MPVDRLFHPRAGHSKKVCSLSDLEFRVWWTYELAADDYGVMPLSAVTVQAANGALTDRPKRSIDAALATLVRVGLLLTFEHQGDRYVCQHDWQNFQRIKYPRETVNPAPSRAVLEQCTPETRALFAQRTPGPHDEGNASERSLSAAVAHTLRTTFGLQRVETEFRVGNSYCDVVVSDDDPVWVFEVKKGDLTPAALAQVLRYRDALQPLWPTKQIAAVLIGRTAAQVLDAAGEHDVTVVVCDDALDCSVLVPGKAWRFAVNFSLSHQQFNEKTPRARETATATAPGNGSSANGTRLTATAPGAENAFLRFWTAYPNKTRRADAETAWAKLGPNSELVDKMLAAIDAQRQSTQWTRESGRFIPNPAKWLSEQRWRDEGTAAQPAVVSTVSRQNRANADEAKRLMRARHGRQ